MNCPICFECINANTGVVTTSCGHSYHYACLTKWYNTQEVSSCPYCRSKPTPTEIIIDDIIMEETASEVDEQEHEGEEEDEEEDEQEEEEEVEEVEMKRAELDVWLRSRGGNGLTDAIAAKVCEVVAGFTFSELNMLCIGNGGTALTDEEWTTML